MANVPLVNAGVDYVTGLQISYTTTTTLTVAAGRCRAANELNDIIIDEAIVINAAANGAAGLDTGALANATFYYVYAVADSTLNNDPSVVVSASASAPTLPSGYNIYRLIGRGFLTDGSAHFLPFKRTGNGLVRKHRYDTQISELAGGNATTFTDVDLASSVPLGDTVVVLQANMVPATADNQLKLRRNGSSSTNGDTQVYGSAATKVSSGQVEVMCDASAVIEYLVSNGSDAATLLVAGFEDVL